MPKNFNRYRQRGTKKVEEDAPVYSSCSSEVAAGVDSAASRKRDEIDAFSLPRNLNWNAVKKAYDFQPKNYEELIGIQGIGPVAVRALALVSELVYGEKPCWEDPLKYSFCVGCKDGVPYPVDRATYDETIGILENAVKQAKVGDKERLNAMKRLRVLANQ